MSESSATVFTTHQGTVVPLDRANVDTDQIIPKQFLKSIKRTGFGENLFDAWRFEDFGEIGKPLHERKPTADFVLNDPRYSGATILLARRNFGCGSSREHAVWALQQYGFVAVIAPSFADIFVNNCFKNGLLPITLPDEKIDELFDHSCKSKAMRLEIDLPAQTIGFEAGSVIRFDINANRKCQLIEGLDEIGLTLVKADLIRDFEAQHRRRMPWLFPEFDS